MKKVIILPLLTAVLLLLNCLPNLESTTVVHAQQPARIAILPCVVENVGMPKSAVSPEEFYRIESGISYSLQREVYDDLLDHVETNHSQTLQLQALTETNMLLEIAGLSLEESWQANISQLAEVLDVDAILRVSVRYDRGTMEVIASLPELPWSPDCVTPIQSEVDLSANLYDASSGLPLWTYGRSFGSKRGRKYEVMARRMVREIGPSLPSFLHYYAQSEVD